MMASFEIQSGDKMAWSVLKRKNSLCIRVVVLNWVVKILGHHRPLLYDDDDGECVMMDDDDNDGDDGDDGDDDGWMDGWTDGWTEG